MYKISYIQYTSADVCYIAGFDGIHDDWLRITYRQAKEWLTEVEPCDSQMVDSWCPEHAREDIRALYHAAGAGGDNSRTSKEYKTQRIWDAFRSDCVHRQ